ncbi:MAG: hypothetical protein ACRC8Q_05420 [Aeromonas sp.]
MMIQNAMTHGFIKPVYGVLIATLVGIGYVSHAQAAIPNFRARCPMDMVVKAEQGQVFINGQRARVNTDAPNAYRAQHGKILISITSASAISKPSVDYVIKHDRRAHGICTVHHWSVGTSSALPMAKGDSPYQGQWMAKNTQSGAVVAMIVVDGQEQVWVNEQKVKAKRTDGALQFRQGTILYTLQGDPRLRSQSHWLDQDAGNSGQISDK